MPSRYVRCLVVLCCVAAGVSLTAPCALGQEGSEGPLPQLQSRPATQPESGLPAQPEVGSRAEKVLDNAAVIRMAKAELGDAVMTQAIRTQPVRFQTGADDLVQLKQAGVSQTVISAMLARVSGMAQHPDPVTVTPLSAEVDDPGVYYKNAEGKWEPVSAELVKFREGGALKSVLTNNVVKKDRNGVVSGPRASLVVATGTEMMIVAPKLADAVEYIVLRFRTHPDRREFRVETGNVFHKETGSDRDQLEITIRKVSSGIFAFTVPHDLVKGEFGVLPPGSAGAPGISHAGKINTFAVRE